MAKDYAHKVRSYDDMLALETFFGALLDDRDMLRAALDRECPCINNHGDGICDCGIQDRLVMSSARLEALLEGQDDGAS
jgi:hypothetical protein